MVVGELSQVDVDVAVSEVSSTEREPRRVDECGVDMVECAESGCL